MSPLKNLVASTAIVAFASGAQAAEGEAPAADPMAQLQQQLAVRDQVIRNLIRRIEQLEQTVGTRQPQAAAPEQAPGGDGASDYGADGRRLISRRAGPQPSAHGV